VALTADGFWQGDQHLKLELQSPARDLHTKETVMAKVIEFYVPKSLRNSFIRVSQPKLGKVIEFCSVARKSAPAQPAGGVLGWLLETTESNRAVGSE